MGYHHDAVGFFERLFHRSKREGRAAREARTAEASGDLAGAVVLYLDAGLADDAARVLLLRADAEGDVEKRLAFCALAADRAESEELRKKARARKALIAFDTLRGRGAAFLASEVLTVARELEETGELDRAAEAYALGGDPESEVRALTAAGAIEKLEERLHESESASRVDRDLEACLRRMGDLDRTAERRAALEAARTSVATREDPRIADMARGIRARLLRGPVVDLAVDGETRRYALGNEVTIGRGDATIVIASRAVSRRHVRVGRGPSGAFVEDLGTRNGTTLAGARLSGSIPVGNGVSLQLGGEVPLRVEPVYGGVAIEVAGARYVAPLADLTIGAWHVAFEPSADEPFVVLRSPEGAERPYLGGLQLAARIELCQGDEISASRGGAARLRVPAQGSAQQDDVTVPGELGP